jgi:hypothetical protein
MFQLLYQQPAILCRTVMGKRSYLPSSAEPHTHMMLQSSPDYTVWVQDSDSDESTTEPAADMPATSKRRQIITPHPPSSPPPNHLRFNFDDEEIDPHLFNEVLQMTRDAELHQLAESMLLDELTATKVSQDTKITHSKFMTVIQTYNNIPHMSKRTTHRYLNCPLPATDINEKHPCYTGPVLPPWHYSMQLFYFSNFDTRTCIGGQTKECHFNCTGTLAHYTPLTVQESHQIYSFPTIITAPAAKHQHHHLV